MRISFQQYWILNSMNNVAVSFIIRLCVFYAKKCVNKSVFNNWDALQNWMTLDNMYNNWHLFITELIKSKKKKLRPLYY